MSRENDIQTIKETAIRFRAKLLYLIDNYEQYYENYSKEALNLHNELFNFNDAVEMLEYKDFSSFDVLNNESIKKVAYLSRQVAKAYSILLQYNEINVDNIELPDGWIVEKDDDNQIVRVIYNKGNDVVFVNKYGEVQSIVKSPTTSKTKFLNKTLQINNAEEMLINASYTYYLDIDRFLPEDDAKRAFDITGKIELGTTFEKKTDQKIKQTKTTMTTAKKVTKKIEKQEKKKEVKIVNNTEKKNHTSQKSSYYKRPKNFQINFTPDIMKEFEKVGNTTNCNLFLNKLTGTLDENIAKKILPNGVKSAMQMYKDWQTNENLECINPQGHFDKNRNASQKVKDAELAGNKANEFANQGYLVLAASPDFDYVTTSGTKHYTAHVSIVITQDTKYNYDAVGDDQTCFLGSNGYTGHQGRKEPEVLRDYPVFLQAGNSTGIVPPGWAFSRGLFLNDKVDYYVVKN